MITILVDLRTDVFQIEENIKFYNPLSEVPGWVWDQSFWQAERHQNYLLRSPHILDPDLSDVPRAYFQSGVGFSNDIKLLEVENRFISEFSRPPAYITCNIPPSTDLRDILWAPRVKTGWFYSQKDRDYLFSNHAIVDYVHNDYNTVDQSEIQLEFIPKSNTPIIISRYTHDNDRSLKISEPFTQVNKFTGLLNTQGIEQDTTNDATVIDTSKREFIVNFNEDYLVKQEILTTASTGPIFSFLLANAPLTGYSVDFSRKDLFRQELTYQEWIDRRAASTLQEGHYFVGYSNSASPPNLVQLYKVNTFTTYGTVSYKKSNPITITLNDNYTVAVTRERIGTSDGTIDQIYFIDIPVQDNSFIEADGLDTDSLTLETFNPTTSTYYTWTRVKDLYELDAGSTDNNPIYVNNYTDTITALGHARIFDFDPASGTIRFGSGSAGQPTKPGSVPEQNYYIYVSYTKFPLLRYEPDYAIQRFSDPRISLSPVANSITRGFLYLSGKLLKPHYLTIDIDLPENPLTGNLGPIIMGMEDITLTGYVTSRWGEPVPGQVIKWYVEPEVGEFVSDYTVTDTDGYSENVFSMGTSINRIGFFGYGYDEYPASSYNFTLDPSGDFEDTFDPRNQNIPNFYTVPQSSSYLVPTSVAPANEETELSGTCTDPDTGTAAWYIIIQERINGLIDINGDIPTDKLDRLAVFKITNDDRFRPWNPSTRQGGRRTVLYTGSGPYTVLKPYKAKVYNSHTVLYFNAAVPIKNTTALVTEASGGFVLVNDNARFRITSTTYGDFDTDDIGRTVLIKNEDASGDISYPFKGDYRIVDVTDNGSAILDRELTDYYTVGHTYKNPTTFDGALYEPEYHIVGFQVVTDIELDFHAELDCIKPTIVSNYLTVDAILADQYLGTYTVPVDSDPDPTSGSALDGANYFNLNSITVSTPNITGFDRIGGAQILAGTNFPTDGRSVWVILQVGDYYTVLEASGVTSTSLTVIIPPAASFTLPGGGSVDLIDIYPSPSSVTGYIGVYGVSIATQRTGFNYA